MDGEQWLQAMDIEQNATELLHGNPYCSNGGTHRGRRVPNVTIQPQWTECSITSPASLVLPHLLLHCPCLDHRVPCRQPLWQTKVPPPRCLDLLWTPLKPQYGAIKLSLKIKNDPCELSALLKPDQHPYPEGGISEVFSPSRQEFPKHLAS
ncbi:uncharacterized protein [Equus przewalskii]|uniref:Uncharacterized protein isoform X2 n=1 Tax=Equus przewalskii TaxID=9798 RepID=A0ABM4QAF8_EQUPR